MYFISPVNQKKQNQNVTLFFWSDSPSLNCKHLLPTLVDPEGHQTCPGAGGDIHCLSGGHGRGEVCAILQPVHAITETYSGECCAEGASAAAWQDHRMH